MTLGDIIKKYRKENNISMSEFASKEFLLCHYPENGFIQ